MDRGVGVADKSHEFRRIGGSDVVVGIEADAGELGEAVENDGILAPREGEIVPLLRLHHTKQFDAVADGLLKE